MRISSLVLDALVIITGIICMKLAVSKGFVRSLVSLIGHVCAIFVASTGAGVLSKYVYDHYIANKLLDEMHGVFASDDLAAGLESFLADLRAKMPFSLLPEKLPDVHEMVESGIDTAFSTISNTVVGPIAISLMQMLFFILLFIVASLIVRLVCGMLIGIRYIPVVGGLDSFLGLIMGALQALVILIIAATFVYLIITNCPNQYLNAQSVGDSLIFRFIYSKNPLLKLF